MKDLKDKVAVVTGASAGIGQAVAEALADQGCKVAILARGATALDEVAAKLRSRGATVCAIPCDLGEAATVRQALARVERELGPVDILVNNVGAGTFKPLHLTSAEECDTALRLPYVPAVTACHAVIEGMRQRGQGHIVNLTSPAGIFPLPFMVPYTAARHAIVGLSHALYEELRGTGVGVSLACPAQVNTGYFTRNDADIRWYPRISTLFPVLEPADVAREVVQAIRHNRREVVFPGMLRICVAVFRKLPRLSVGMFRILGLWGPSRQDAT
jgi:short-subunit dehydrogenase